jgi:hypothetical protein
MSVGRAWRSGEGRNVSQKPDANSIDRLKSKFANRDATRRNPRVQYSESPRSPRPWL